MENLKKCPFCGGDAIRHDNGRWFQIGCGSVLSCKVRPKTDHYSNEEAAIQAWNRRAGDEQTEADG